MKYLNKCLGLAGLFLLALFTAIGTAMWLIANGNPERLATCLIVIGQTIA